MMETLSFDTPSLLTELYTQWETLGGEQACRLWIACSDHGMNDAARRIRRWGRELVVREFGGGIGQQAWLHDVASRAVDHFPIDEIVLCGHSGCSAIPEDEDEPHLRRSPPADRLLRGAVRRMAHNARCRQAVVDQIEALQSDARIAELLEADELRVTGMFYLEESGIFTVYNAATETFDPLEPLAII